MHEKASHDYTVTGSKIIELAKNAHNLFIRQDSTEQARLLKTLLSNCTFDRGSVSATYSKPFDLLAEGNETGNWLAVRDDFRNWLLTAVRSVALDSTDYECPTEMTTFPFLCPCST
jgi:hypothetical protein